MKNIFKSLMLVAVAAMAFTACQKDNDETNKTEQTRVVNFSATIGEDDTRSGFTEKVGNAYKSAWDGGEMLILYTDNDTQGWPTIDEHGQFSVSFAEGSKFVSFLSPAGSWDGWGTNFTAAIPMVQTPRANSVDPAAHILRAQNVPIDSDNISFSMQHEVAYGKMTVDDTPAEFEIAKVVINLVGDYYGDKNLTYTLNATNVENNTFWFATEPINVSEFTVKAYDSNGNIMARTVSDIAENGLKFDYGRVSTFSVSGLEEYVAPAAPVFTNASETHRYGDQDRILTFTGDLAGTIILNLCYVFDGNAITTGTYYTEYNSSGYIYTNGYSKYNDVGIYGGSINVSVVDGKYFIEFVDLKDENGNIILEYSSFNGQIDNYSIPDTRIKLSAPEITSTTIKGKTVTYTWNAVEGADSYYIYCFQDNSVNASVTDTTVTLTMPEYSTYYYCYIKTVADDDNTDYRSSEELMIPSFSTYGSEDAIAMYMWDDTFVWNSSSYFEIRDNSTWGSSYWYIYLNENDRPGNNSIKERTYMGVANTTTPAAGKFSIKIGSSGTAPFNSIYSSQVYENDTLTVKIVDGKYEIIFNHQGTTHGYVGLPDGFVLPN